ncbi:MAG: hypothetical protein CVV44_09835 [Spirochaetae bacterium HGW-Spirochaetae-1]|jgi:PKD repeat protein|nr:MAG: hypothetical protein CVV44_09835 [Spirochaetae bacterium HGW-Spirochaetae-1]
MKKISIFIMIISAFVSSMSCFDNSMIEKGELSMEDPRLPEINIKQGGTPIPDNSGVYDVTGARVGGAYTDVVFTIENIGTAELNLIGSPRVSIENDTDNEFQVIEQPSEAVIAPGRNSTFSVRFSPVSSQEKAVTVSIVNDDFDEGDYTFTLNGISVPDVDFRARLRRGIAPLTVNFESLSTGNITKLEWDFNGDGTVDATGATAEYQYINPGTYTVVLNATGVGGVNYRIKTSYVTTSSPQKHVIDDGFNMATAVRAADIDGDSYMDIVATSYEFTMGTPVGTDEIAWWKNDGSGTFTKNIITDTFEYPQYLSVADMDFDGDLDVICQGKFDGGQIYWWENGGDGTSWTEHAITSSYHNMLYFDVYDMDGDSDMDLVSFSDSTAYGSADYVNFCNNQINLGYGWSMSSIISLFASGGIGSAHFLYLADFNNDTYQDILVGGYYGVRWYMNSGNNTSYTEYEIGDISTTDNMSHKAVADIDNDGDSDVFSIVSNTGTEILWYDNAMGTSGWEQDWEAFTITTDSKGIDRLRAFDVNDDGKTDLIGGSQNFGDICWWENNGVYGDSSWLKHQVASTFTGICGVDAADFNGDGVVDILGTRISGEIAWWDISHTDWFSRTIDSSNGSPAAPYPVDIDGDGDLDLIGGYANLGEVVLYENHGDASFIDPVTIDSSFTSPYSFYAVDLDRDNDVDIIVSGSADIAWYENDGDNNFTRHDVANDLSYAYSVCAADLNGDDEIDLICTSHYNNAIFWWDNDGNETFATKHILDGNINWPKSIAVGDIDGNSTVDVVVAGSGTSGLAWYNNNGTGTFVKTVLGSGSNSVHICDLDDDGHKDIVVYECIDNAIDWWKNDGSQNFSLQTSLATGLDGDYTKIYIADFNGDGDHDIVSTNVYGNAIVLLENDGSEVFTMHSIETEFASPSYVHAADMDNDGDSDILAVSGDDDTIVLWENNILEYGE